MSTGALPCVDTQTLRLSVFLPEIYGVGQAFICLFLTCVAVEMCKVSKTGAGAGIHAGRGSKDVSTQVTEKVKPLVMELLLMGLATTHHWRLLETRDGKLQVTECTMCVSKSS